MDLKFEKLAEARKIPEKNILPSKFSFFHLKLRDLGYILYRNIFVFLNGIIFLVVGLLYVFGDRQAALFLGLIFIFNILLGLFQDINAWLALEKLQFLTAPYTIRLKKDRTCESVPTEGIVKGDQMKLKVGDQVPCDGVVIDSNSMEINEGLITGESNSLTKAKGEEIFAGSVITAGSGIIEATTVYSESRISRMTDGVNKHTLNLSTIQKEVGEIVKYSGYILVVVIAFVITRGVALHEPELEIVKNIGALASLIIPAGLIFAMTIFFAYGAARLFKRKILLQEVSATEKLGRIKNLCMDKTGTITENFLTVEKMAVPEEKNLAQAERLVAAYISGTNDSSQVFQAVGKFIKIKDESEIFEVLAFSSWRRYGAVRVKENNKNITVFAGSPDTFLPHLKSSQEKQWLETLIETNSPQGKHLLCVACLEGENVDLPLNLNAVSLSLVAIFIFRNNLRPGIREAIDFFQDRGVRIRIISGDNPETARAIADQAGIKELDKSITGQEMKLWNEADFASRTKWYSIFSRIMPEQKEKIIEALKKDGFTAMIGDGANDVLAVKNADLGIAMFEGAPATRQLASVVLMNNSFSALPGGVKLADTIITNLEILASIFLNVSFVGLFFFVLISVLGFEFPLTPLNVTVIDYCAIGLPGLLIAYWSTRPSDKVHVTKDQPFLKRILPFTILSAGLETLSLVVIYWLSPNYLKLAQPNPFVLIEFSLVGFIFCIYAFVHFLGKMTLTQKLQISVLAGLEALLLFIIFITPFFANFFGLIRPNLDINNILEILLVTGLFIFLQHNLTKRLILKK